MNELILDLPHQSKPWDNIVHGSPSLTSIQQDSAFNFHDTALGPPPFQNGDEVFCNTGFMQAVLSEDAWMQDPLNFFTSTLNFTDVDLVESSHFDSEFMLSVSPVSLMQADSNAGTLALVTALPSPAPESSITSPFSEFLNLDEPSSGLLECQHPVNRNFWDPTPANRIKFYGRNPVDIIPAVQMIDTFVRNCQNDTFQFSLKVRTGTFSKMLADELRRETFLSQIHDVAIWAYNAAADFTRQRRNTRKLGYYSNISTLPLLYQEDNQMSHVQSGSIVSSTEHSMRASVLTCCFEVSTNSPIDGTLRIQLRWEPQNASNNGIDSSCYFSIFAVPKVGARSEAAIQVTVPIKIHSMPMYTTIRTFNVVPDDSEIMQCVMMNDLDGFRRLISENKASPTDVCSQGLSLLNVGLRWYLAFGFNSTDK
jgi:hypothetical protein